MKNRRNYYRILHVQPDAPAEVIRMSYRTLMLRLKMHPDLGGDHWNALLINEAFATLNNPKRRSAYDALMNGLRNRQRSQDRAALAGVPSVETKREPIRSTVAYCRCFFCGARHGTRTADSPQATCHQCQSPLFLAGRHERLTATRRTLERLPRRMTVSCTEAGRPHLSFPMTTSDVSLGGTCVISPHKLSPGQILRIEYSFGKAVGVITHVTENDSAGSLQWYAGVRFLTLQVTDERGAFLSVKG